MYYIGHIYSGELCETVSLIDNGIFGHWILRGFRLVKNKVSPYCDAENNYRK